MKSEFDKKSSQIREMSMKTPQEFSDHLAETHKDVANALPNIAPHISSIAARAVNFLASKLPRPAVEFPGQAEWQPSKSQQASFLHYYDAINNPIGILDHVKDGTLSMHHMEALNAVHPDLLRDMQTKVMENATPKNMQKLNYSKKIALSKFLGQPMTQSLLPGAVLASQASFNKPMGAPSASAPKRKSSSLGGLSKLNRAQESATETQRDEEES